MGTIYHLVLRRRWEETPDQPYRADSLASEGFIHCSNAAQVAGAANRFYADQQDLLVLHIDPARLTSPVQEEPSGTGERFPHIYGPINRDAVIAVQTLAARVGRPLAVQRVVTNSAGFASGTGVVLAAT